MTYTVTGTGGCPNATDTRTVTVTAAPVAGTLSGTQNVCVALTTTFSSTQTGGTWSTSDGTIATIDPSTGVITGIASGTATMTYTVTGTGGCPNATDTRTVTVTAAPVAGTLSGTQNVCVALTTTFSSTQTGGTWSTSDGTIATIDPSTGVITGIAAGLATMTYTVTGTGGCPNATDTRTVTVTAAPVAGTLSGTQNVCLGTTTTFSSTQSGGTWSSSNTAITTVNPTTGEITAVSGGNAIITYTVAGTGGCPDATATRSVTVPTSDTDGDGLTDCEETTGIDDPSTPTVPSGTSNPNDPCDPNPIAVATGDCDGDGQINGTDPNAGTATANDDSGSVTVGTTAIIDILTNDDYLDNADGNNLGSTSITQTGGTAGGTITFNPALGTLDYTPLAGEAGTTVTVVYQVCNDASGSSVCATATVTITVLADSDNDGVPDIVDIDDDNDGIPDTYESGGNNPNADADNDGVPAYLDENDTNNTIGNDTPGLEKLYDFDGDGIPNHLDLDSDNDAIPDVIEAGYLDTNNDGLYDSVNYGINGLVDEVETSSDSGILISNPVNTDAGSDVNPGWTLYNFLDVDSDNDGITDTAEAFSNNSTYNDANNDGQIDGFVDADGNGWHDTIDAEAIFPTPLNSDADSIPNYLDLDSDGDGLPDTFEGNFQVPDGDNNGIIATGIPSDSDGDGLADTNDPDFAGNILGGFGFNQDRDNDGVKNYLDIDIDNDGIIDNIEGQSTFSYIPPSGIDTDGDGIDNAYDVNNGGVGIGYTNTDGGSAPDYADTNSDGVNGVGDAFDILENATNNTIDGPLDLVDNGNGSAVPDGMVDPLLFVDADGDGLHDDFDNVITSTSDPLNATNNNQLPTDQPDTDPVGGDRDWREISAQDKDNDGIPDVTDLDDDNDGILDTVEDQNLDLDGDPRTNPTDTDGDGVPDYFDLDSDNDGIPDYTEAGGTNDPDGNGMVGTGVLDNTEVDSNGIPLAVGPSGLTPFDTDGDGIADYKDLDSDNDGIADVIEAGGIDPDGDGYYGGGITNDADADGLIDALDPYDDRAGNSDTSLGGIPLVKVDTDGDGQFNYLDLDSDNDTIPDNVEGQSTVGYVAPSGLDTDLDGLDNSYDTNNGGTAIVVVNTDGVDTPDYLDLDSDNDTLFDIVEAGNGSEDTDSDGETNGVTGANGLDNIYDDAIAGDTYIDPNGALDNTQFDNFPDSDSDVLIGGDVDYRDATFNDNDGDGIDDVTDLDDDNDGILDNEESNGADPLIDSDGDNIPNYQDSDFCTLNSFGICANLDPDNDGTPNHFDTDSDNDGCNDANEAYDSSTTDSNGDGTYGGVITPTEVDANGQVITASYLGTNANVITATNVTIATQPENQSTNVGGDETFSVVVSAASTSTYIVSGTPDYTLPTPATDVSGTTVYQWQEDSGSGFADIADGGIYSGSTTAILTLTGVTSTMNGNNYQVIITHPNNVCSNITSNAGTLTLIAAVDDDFSTTPVAVGDSTPTVVTNDTLNGVGPVVIGTSPGEVTLTGVTVPAGLTLNTDGTITVNSNTPSGTYTVVYEICEVGATPNPPGNCDQATVTVVVANIIAAVDDDFSTTPVAVGDSTPTVVTNDTLNGVGPVVIGTSPGEVTLTGVTVPAGLTLNTDGTITVNSNTPSGTYTVVYEICEVGATPNPPGNCDQATVTVVVANIIAAVDDDFSTTPVAVGDSTPTVVTNDTLNGVGPVVIGTSPGEVTLTGVTVPAGLTLNTDGTITVNSNTPSGTYTVVYEICEVGATPNPPGNCDQATVTVVVANIIAAVDDDFSTTPVAVGDSTPTVVTNDTLNGVGPVVIGTSPGEVTLTGVTVPAGLTLNTDGTITVNSNTPSGTYTVVYEICEVGATPNPPGNCDQATVTVVVANIIAAVDDDFSTTPVAVGDSTPTVVTNDTLNGVGPVVIGTSPGEVTLTGVTVPAGLTLNTDGTITVNSNTPSGTYTVVYEICEVGATPNPPGNCDQATVTVVVANIIAAVDDDFSTTPVAVGDSTPTVVTNDTLNGVGPVVIGTSPGEVTLTGVTVPAGLTLNTDGTITVNSNTPSGTYTVVYEICEVGATPNPPGNCDQATVTVVVANIIAAVDDDFSTTPVAVGDSTPTVVTNDTLNGVGPVVIGTSPGEVTLTGVTVPAGLTLNTDGTITVNSNTPSGTYTVVYEICEVGATPNPPGNCDQATVTVVVANIIAAVDDDFSTTPVAVGDSTPTVVTNDTLNGVGPVVIGTSPGEVTLTGVTVPAGLTLNTDGTITVNSNTPSGTYTVVYEICEVGATPNPPGNCDQATVTVVVANIIAAVDDDFSTTPVAVGDSTPTVVTNDTLNGVGPVVIGTSPGEVTLTGVTVPAGLTLNTDGTITVNSNTPSGTYTVVYEICEVGATPNPPGNCDQATVTVVVANIIAAVDDDFSTTPVAVGDSTPTVVTNDTLNGVGPVVIGTSPGEVTLTGVTVPAGLTLNTDGTITVNSNTPSGTYTVVYEICEVGATPNPPGNCDQATVTVVVANIIAAVDDDFSTTPVAVGDSTPTVVTNDTLNGVGPVVIGTSPGEVTLTGVTVPAGLTLNTDGTITVNSNTPSGTYTVVYEICEVGATPNPPGNCDQATVTVVVANIIAAVDDDFSTTPVAVGDSTPTVVTNDTLNGVGPVVIGTSPGEVTLTGVTVPAGLTLNTDGTITVNSNTPSGTYTVVYEICEVGATPNPPGNCDQATVTVVVANIIAAVDDDFSTTPVAVGDSTPTVVTNDTLNGVGPVVIGTSPGEVTLTGVTVPAGLTLNTDGTITVNSNTPSGTYTVVYEICEVGATPNPPGNCDQATVTVVVANIIAAVDDDFSTTPVAVGDSTPTVVTNDTLNGVGPVVIGTSPGEVTLTGVTVPAGLTLNTDGTITVNSNTPSGTYTVVYEICEVGATPNPPGNCDQATVTVVVANIIDAVDDGPQTIIVTTTDPIAAGTVLTNDTLSGVQVTTGNTDVTPITTGPISIDIEGNVTILANTTAGTYTITYELCEVGAVPANCDTATATFIIVTDSDGDGVSDVDELNPPDGEIPTDPNDPCSYLVSDITMVVTNTADCTAEIEVTKTADYFGVKLGNVINYTITVENIGNVRITRLNLVDNFMDAQGNVISLTTPVTFESSDLGSSEGVLLVGEYATYTATFTITQEAINASGVSNSVVASGMAPNGDIINDVSDNGDDFDGNISDDPTVTQLGCLITYNEFSPNNDGINDTFVIGCIENYPNNKLEVYNRWGNIVYTKRGYNNEFDGTSNGRVTVNTSEKLPNGTYYYILDLGEGSKPKVGWLYINR